MPEGPTPRYHVFLSHNSRDKGAVEVLAGLLQEKGLNPFLDKWNLVPGEAIEDGLIRALDHSDSAVIFVGPGGDGPWQSEEMRKILQLAVKSRNEFRAIPVLLPESSSAALEKSFLGSRLWIEFKSVDDADALLRLAKAIQGEASGGGAMKLPDEPAPYRGLERFERIEKPEEDFFFGRDEEIRALTGRLVKQRFVAVVGASGSGKSSLIRAGLTKQLAEEIHPGIRRWTTITVEPGSAPFRALAIQVAVAAGFPAAEREVWVERTVEKWTASSDGVRQTIETLFAGAQEPLLVFIDQFEEIFTHRREGSKSEGVARNFVANLADLWRRGGDRVRVALALRADFVVRCLEIGPLKELLQDRTMLVGEVGDDALREIVKEPAARVGAYLEKGLMERILKDVRSGSGSLPLLQQALHGLWKDRTGAWLTHDTYNKAGGVARALNDQAQAAFTTLDAAQRKIADILFPRLITLGEGVADTRRRVQRSELYPRGVEPGAVNAVIDALSGKDARILVTTRAGATEEDLGSGEDFVEFTHEALLSNWEHLGALLNRERASIRRHRGLTTAAAEWDSKPEDERPKFLLRAGQLVIAGQWAKDEGGAARLTDLEARFLKASIDERDAEETRKAKSARRFKMLGIGASVAAVVAMGFGIFAFQQKTEALEQKKEATERKTEAEQANAKNLRTLHEASLPEYTVAVQRIEKEGKWHEGVAYLVRALKWESRNPFAATRLYSTLSFYASEKQNWPRQTLRHEDAVVSAQFSPDGSRIVTICEDKTARIWDAATGKQLGEPLRHGNYVNSAQFSPDGTRIVTASDDKTAQVWDAATGRQLGEPLRLKGVVYSAQFSPDGTRIVTASDDKTARVWDAVTGKQLGEPLGREEIVFKPFVMDPPFRLVTAKNVLNAQFSPDGTRIVTKSDDKSAQVWDAATGQPLTEVFRHEKQVTSMEFNADGTRIVTASDDNTARVWDAATGKPLGEPLGHEGHVYRAQFSPDGSRIVTASFDKTARVWDAVTGRPLGEPLRHEGAVLSAQFSPDGSRIVTVSFDKTARVWDAGTSKPLGAPLGHEGNVYSAQFNPDGTRIVTACGDKTARVWDVAPGKPTGEPLRHAGAVRNAQFSPDGSRIVTASYDKTARVWDVATGKPLIIASVDDTARVWDVATGKPLGAPLRLGDGAERIEFSPDGSRIVTVSQDTTAQVWETASGKALGDPLRHEEKVWSTQFSPDGSRIVTVTWRTAWVWAAATGKLLGKPLRHELAVTSTQFSADGSRIVTASEDTTARVWEAATGKPLVEPLRHKAPESGLGCPVRSAHFSPDGTRIVTSSNNDMAQVWDAATGKPLGEPLRHKEEVLSAQFSPDGTRIVTGSTDKAARVWDVATGKPLGESLWHEDRVTSAQFNSNGSLLVTVSFDGTARVWAAATFTRPPIPVPDWMLERASALAGFRFTADGELQPIPVDERITILQKPTPGNDPWAVLARWLVLPAEERTVTPDSRFTCRQLAERERDTLLREGLESALRYDPTIPLARVLLAGALMHEDAAREANRRDTGLPQRAAFLRDYDLQRMPDDAGLWERAVRALHEQKDEERKRRALGKLEKLDKDRAAAVRKELGL